MKIENTLFPLLIFYWAYNTRYICFTLLPSYQQLYINGTITYL